MCISLVQITVFAYDDQVGLYQEYGSEGELTGKLLAADDAGKAPEDGDLVMSKTIAQTGENEFDITLLVTTTESLEEIPLSQDAAVVLLIDASPSMEWDVSGSDEEVSEEDMRITLAKTAAKKFVDSFGIDENGGKRMVAVGAFDKNAWRVSDWRDANDATKGEANRTDLKKAIEDIKIGSSTNPDAALQLADNLYGNDAVKDIASRFVILLTDGQPNAKKSGEGNQEKVKGTTGVGSKTAADAAADTAKTLKSGTTHAVNGVAKPVTLYTLAFATADAACYDSDICKNCGKPFETGADTLGGSYTFQYYTASGDEAQHTETIYRVDQMTGDVTVDFYYVQDNSVSVTYSIKHVYRRQDWDNPELEVEMETSQTNPGTKGKAGQIVTAKPDCLVIDGEEEILYELDSVSISNGKVGEYSMKLAQDSENAIVIYYSRNYDSRKATVVEVNHHYSVRDTYTDVITDEGVVAQRFSSYVDGSLDFDGTGIYVGSLFKATLQETHTIGDKSYTYGYKTSTPADYTIGTLPKAEYGEDGLLLNNIIDIYYERTVSSAPSTDPDPDPDPRPDPDDDDDDEGYDPIPPVIIPDEETPTTEFPTEEVVEIPEEEVPLDEFVVPTETGDNQLGWILAAAASGIGLVWMALCGKKRRDESAQ